MASLDLSPIPIDPQEKATVKKFNWGKGVQFPYAPNLFKVHCVFCGVVVPPQYGLAFRTGETNAATGGALYKTGCPICMAQEMRSFWQKYPDGVIPVSGQKYVAHHDVFSLAKEYMGAITLAEAMPGPSPEVEKLKERIKDEARMCFTLLCKQKEGKSSTKTDATNLFVMASTAVLNQHEVDWNIKDGPAWKAVEDEAAAKIQEAAKAQAFAFADLESASIPNLGKGDFTIEMWTGPNPYSLDTLSKAFVASTEPYPQSPLDDITVTLKDFAAQAGASGKWFFPAPDGSFKTVKILPKSSQPIFEVDSAEFHKQAAISDLMAKKIAEQVDQFTFEGMLQADVVDKKALANAFLDAVHKGVDESPFEGEKPAKTVTLKASWEYESGYGKNGKIKAPAQQGVVPKSKQHKTASYPKMNFKGKKGSW